MPFLTAQKKREIVRVLGYPYTYVSNFNVLGTDIDQDILTEIDELLLKYSETDADARTQLSSANIKRLDDIEFFDQKQTSTIDLFERSKMNYAKEISSLIGIPMAYGYRHEVRYQ